MMTQHRAIVIGTGFGGAVAACRLAQAGIGVTVFERGRRYDKEPHGFPRQLGDRWLWQKNRGLFDVSPLSEMQVVQAAGYGGGSLIYANVHLRPPDAVFASGWPEGYSRQALDPYFDLVAYMLDIQPITKSPAGMPKKTLAMQEAAAALGRTGELILPPLAVRFSSETTAQPNKFGVPQKGCTHCGQCVIGCPERAKNTLDLNYLAVAERLGAVMRTEQEVTIIEPRPGGEPGYRVHYRDLAHGGSEHFEDAAHVFVCAGALHSTALLLRSRAAGALPELSRELGKSYSGNGDLLAFAFDTDTPWEPSNGPTITTALVYDRLQDKHPVWFLLEEGGFPPHLWPLVLLAGLLMPDQQLSESLGPELAEYLAQGWKQQPQALSHGLEDVLWALAKPAPLPKDLAAAYRCLADRVLGTTPITPPAMDKTGIFLAMGRDLANGSIDLCPDGRLDLAWDAASNLLLYSQEERLVRDVARQWKAAHAPEPFWRYARLPVSVHNLGGCKMGTSPDSAVTSELGEVFHYPGLFIMDGAILPGSTGVNPAHTIAAVAERNIERIIRRITGDLRWTAPERAHATPYEDPLTAVKIPPQGTKEPLTPALQGRCKQRIEGTWQTGVGRPGSAGAVRCELSLILADVHAFLADPAHVAMADGRIAVAGLTAGEVKIRGGICHVFALHGSSQRKVQYMLPFDGKDGCRYGLHAMAALTPLPRRELWKLGKLGTRPIRVPFQICEDADPRKRIVGHGSLEIDLLALVRTVLSLRLRGSGGIVDTGRALLDLVEFVRVSVTE